VPLIKELFKEAEDEDAALSPGTKTKKKEAKTLGSSFMNQLGSLVSTIRATEPHYVRCVKPNTEKKVALVSLPIAYKS
jgi:myosin-5